MLDVVLAASGLLAVAVGATSRLLRELPVSPPLLAVTTGVILGPSLLGLADIPASEQAVVMETASRLLLAVALMAVALRYPVEEVARLRRPVGILLLVVMPAMALAVAGVGAATLGLPFGLAAAIGAALAPTDPVLASSVVSGEPAERDIPAWLRQVLSTESGANDGLALPFAMAGAALVLGDSAGTEFGTGLLEVGWGAVLGVALGLGAGRLLQAAEQRRDIDSTSVTLFALVLAFAVLGVAALAGGNDILAVFAAGLAFNRMLKDSERTEEARIDEGLNQFLVLPVFILFGLTLPWEAWGEMGWAGVLFVAGVLVFRRLPWVLLLYKSLGMRFRDAIWLGWFGPIGVAAIFYLAFLHHQGVTDPVVWEAGSLIIFASTVVHGATAAFGRRAYARVDSM